MSSVAGLLALVAPAGLVVLAGLELLVGLVLLVGRVQQVAVQGVVAAHQDLQQRAWCGTGVRAGGSGTGSSSTWLAVLSSIAMRAMPSGSSAGPRPNSNGVAPTLAKDADESQIGCVSRIRERLKLGGHAHRCKNCMEGLPGLFDSTGHSVVIIFLSLG